MKVQVERNIYVSGEEIIKNYLCKAIGIHRDQYEEFIKEDSFEVRWDIKETGDHDKGTYKRELKELIITLKE